METEYRGHKIYFSEHSEKWSVDIDGYGEYANDSFAKVKGYVDKAKKRNVYGVLAIKKGGWNHNRPYVAVKITSVTPDGDVWLVDVKSGRRSKYYHSDKLWKTTKKNKAIISVLVKLLKTREDLEQKAQDLENKLDPVDLTTILEK